MAEAITIVGAIASTIQLVDFTIKVFDRLNHYLHLVDEVPESLRGIRLHLPLFIEALRRTQFHIDHGHYNPMTSAVLKSFVDECNSQMILLEDILAKVAPAQDDSKMIRSRKAVCSLKHEKALKKIHFNLSGYIEKLLLFQSTVSSDYIMGMMKPMLSQNSVLSENLTATTTRSTGRLVADSKSIWATKLMSQKTSKSLANYYKNKKQYRFSQFMGFYWLGIPWAFQASLDLSWGNYGFSITPNLRMQQLVKHTSPAFEVFWKCQTDRQDIQSAREALFELFSTGTVSPQDVDPDGRTWLERILSVRISANHDMLIAFFKMLCEWGTPLNTKTSLLSLCAGWSGSGPHLTLLRELIAVGYDLSTDTCNSPFTFSKLPFAEPLFGFPGAYTDMPDPFLLKFFMECSKNACGVWGQTPFMDAILCGSATEITKFLQCPQFFQGRNVFGQTPIHLAVLRPSVLLSVLEVWPNFDITDDSGRSPLVYAAAYGCVESVVLLLKAGVDQINSQHLDFLDYARAWRHWDVVTEALTFFRTTGPFSDTFLKSQVHCLMANYLHLAWQGRPEDFKIMIDLGANPHFLFEDGNTLLHRLWHDTQVNVLFEAGYEYIDRSNSEGQTALMSSISRCHCLIYNNILARGCNVNHQDNRGLSALHIACQKMDQDIFHHSADPSYMLQNVSRIIVLIATLLHHGADPLMHDNCRCPCSPNGCSPSTKLLYSERRNASTAHIWVLDWLLTLRELRGETTAQKALAELVRAIEFERAGMTHVCCQRKAFSRDPMEEEEIDEILDEEKDFISELNNTMEQFVQSIDDGSIEENWLKTVVSFHAPETDNENNLWSWATWKGVSSSMSNNCSSPPPWQMQDYNNRPIRASTASAVNEPHYWIDETCDEFRREQGPITMQRIRKSRLYSAWVQYFYRNQALHDYPTRIGKEWHERRKYWATRQAEILDNVFSSQ